MGGACRATGKMINAYTISVEKAKGDRLFGRPTSQMSGKY
jgi:hypothetical protein